LPPLFTFIGKSHANFSILSWYKHQVSGLRRQDYITGEEGYTLAAALLLGKDELIQNILPYYKIEILVKIKDVDRYDDRLTLTTNLIDSYDKIMDFLMKSGYLPNKFFMEGEMRIDLREKIFREVVANLLVHREYTNAHIASIAHSAPNLPLIPL
jgi:ATP-dependent DNA helicase RecG